MTFDQTWYAVGTASVTAGSATVTGQSSNWLSGGIIAGDYFWAAGDMVPILTVNSNTSITLTDGWTGANRTTASYKIIPASDAVRVLTATRAVLSLLTNGNVEAVAGLTLAANKAPYATGSGALALHDQTTFGRAIQGLTGSNGGFIRGTGAGTAVMQAIVGSVAQSGGVPTGAIIERGSNANGEFVRFADGTQICLHILTPIDITSPSGAFFTSSTIGWTFPASFAAGPRFIGGRINDYDGFFIFNAAGATGTAVSPCRAFTTQSIAARAIHVAAIGRWF